MLVASFIRPWLAGILLFPLTVFAAFGLRTLRAPVLVIAVAIAALPLAVSTTTSRLGMKEGDDAAQSIDKLNTSYQGGGSTRQLGDNEGTVGSLVALTPLGMLSVLFRPFPGEVNNMFGMMAGVENTVLLAFFLRAVWRTPARELRDPFLLWAIVLILVWLAGYATVAAANVGTSVRYRLQIMPLYLWLLAHFSRKRGLAGATSPIRGGRGGSGARAPRGRAASARRRRAEPRAGAPLALLAGAPRLARGGGES